MKDGDLLSVLVYFILIMTLAACLFMAGRELFQYEKARAEYRKLDELITEIPEETISKDEEETIQEEVWWPELDIDFAAYEEINPDFVGILYMPLFDMRYPIALSQDNREYLTKTFEGQENASGCIFMDYQNNRRFTDRNTYLYGHNMRDGSMFGSLKRLVREPQICEGDPKIYIYTPDYILEYQLYVVELSPADERLPNIYSDTRYDEYRNLIVSRARRSCIRSGCIRRRKGKPMEETTIINEPMSTTESVRDRILNMGDEEFVITVPVGLQEGGGDGRE